MPRHPYNFFAVVACGLLLAGCRPGETHRYAVVSADPGPNTATFAASSRFRPLILVDTLTGQTWRYALPDDPYFIPPSGSKLSSPCWVPISRSP